MIDFKTKDCETWKYLQKCFSVSKCSVPFTASRSDHGVKQENKAMKVCGRIKGFARHPSALYSFCLVFPILSSLSAESFSKSTKIICNKKYITYTDVGYYNE